MTKGQLPEGTIIAAKYTYGDEILHYKFYQIVSYSTKRVRIVRLRDIVTYDDGMPGPHYFNDPKHIQPLEPYEWDEASKSVSYQVNDQGYMVIRPEEYYRSVGDWDGNPLEIYNLH